MPGMLETMKASDARHAGDYEGVGCPACWRLLRLRVPGMLETMKASNARHAGILATHQFPSMLKIVQSFLMQCCVLRAGWRLMAGVARIIVTCKEEHSLAFFFSILGKHASEKHGSLRKLS